MADKSIDQLNEAEKIYATDLFVLQQSGSAKKLTGQVLLNWLTAAADGHGGIKSIEKLSTSVLADTYRIALADTTTFDFVVTNGKGITGISKTNTSGLVDTYAISYNDGTTSKFTVTNGAKGDKGDNTYVWIKYASQEPTESSHSMGDIPDDWIGIYSGNASTAPTDWKQYRWFKHKGEKGDTGNPATLANKSVTYQVGDSGTIIPSGAWGSSIPAVSQGKYLWTKTELQFNTGDPIVSYSVARMGIDGSGAVSTVCEVSPDETGNITLTASDVGALSTAGGNMTGAISMNGQPISGLNDPTEDTQAARKGYVDTAKTEAQLYTDTAKSEANAYTDASVRRAAPRNILDNSDFTNLVAQAGIGGNHGTVAYAADRWILDSGTVSYEAGVGLTLNGTIRQNLEFPPTGETSAFVGMASGAASISYADGAVTITSSGGVLKWAALYGGAYKADTMPEYQPKGYGTELRECQRYYFRWIPTYAASALGFVANWTGTSARLVIYLPATMRNQGTLPTISFKNIKISYRSSTSDITPSSASVLSEGGNIIHIGLTIANGTKGDVGYLIANDTIDSYMEISKDI